MPASRNVRTTLRKALAVSGAVGMAVNTACYSYVPVQTNPPPESDVRVELNKEGTADLARYLGPSVVAVDGKLSAVAADGSLVIAASMVQIEDGPHQLWTGKGVVTFPQGYLSSVQVRTLNRSKSTIAGIAIAVSLITVMELIVKGGGSNSAASGGGAGNGIFSIHR
jgi:hypothetical protein